MSSLDFSVVGCVCVRRRSCGQDFARLLRELIELAPDVDIASVPPVRHPEFHIMPNFVCKSVAVMAGRLDSFSWTVNVPAAFATTHAFCVLLVLLIPMVFVWPRRFACSDFLPRLLSSDNAAHVKIAGGILQSLVIALCRAMVRRQSVGKMAYVLAALVRGCSDSQVVRVRPTDCRGGRGVGSWVLWNLTNFRRRRLHW